MISYELVTKLEEAEFPYQQDTDLFDCIDFQNNPCSHLTMGSKQVPTLSELIAACGSDCFRLYVVGNEWPEWLGKWRARNLHVEGQEIGAFDSPEEAVANLYLAIHKK